MPILPAEPEMYPDDLWQEVGLKTDSQHRWWCLHTKPRQEKMAARVLRKRQVPYYLPRVTHESRIPSGRRIRSVLPLFPGYLFLHGDDYQRTEARTGNHLANILEVPDQATLEQDLRQIHQMLSSGLPVIPEPTHVVGSKIQIRTGPLKGMIGTVIRRGKQDHFVAQVQFLGRGAMIELQDWQVEPVRN
jgi:transcription antitermination factor NusG